MVTLNQPCQCGSGNYPIARYDGYNIFLCYACVTCWPQKRKRYRSDIFSQYECDEPIEAD